VNILHITDGIPPDVLGGSGRIAWDTATALAREGHTVTMLTSAKNGAFPNKRDGVNILTIPPRGRRWAHYRSVFSKTREQEMMERIRSVKPEVIHAHVIAGQCGYRWIAKSRKIGIPVIITCHDVMNVALGRVLPDEKNIWLKDLKRLRWSWNPFRTAIVRRILQRHCTIVTVSDALRTWMERFGYKNLRTLHNGIDLGFWKTEDKINARNTLNLPKDATIFLLAGRLGIDKGTEEMARTLPASAHLLLAGDADLRTFETIKDRVHFFSRQTPEQMRTLYAASDAVLVPSRCLDCFPTIVLETMACGRAVLATNWGGAKEAVLDGKTGWVMHPLDEPAWKARMEWCLTHKDELHVMGESARSHMEASFTQKKYLEELLRIYGEVLL
jgi:glycosyltransferase involved in cell wall biosynthesis